MLFSRLRQALAMMYRTAQSLLSWGRADGWAQLAPCRRLPASHRHLCGRRCRPGQASRAKFLPHPDLDILPGTVDSWQNWPPDNYSLPRHHNQCNKHSKECAVSSTNTDTLCVSRMCQMVSRWHVLILAWLISVYFSIALFVHQLYMYMYMN